MIGIAVPQAALPTAAEVTETDLSEPLTPPAGLLSEAVATPLHEVAVGAVSAFLSPPQQPVVEALPESLPESLPGAGRGRQLPPAGRQLPELDAVLELPPQTAALLQAGPERAGVAAAVGDPDSASRLATGEPAAGAELTLRPRPQLSALQTRDVRPAQVQPEAQQTLPAAAATSAAQSQLQGQPQDQLQEKVTHTRQPAVAVHTPATVAAGVVTGTHPANAVPVAMAAIMPAATETVPPAPSEVTATGLELPVERKVEYQSALALRNSLAMAMQSSATAMTTSAPSTLMPAVTEPPVAAPPALAETRVDVAVSTFGSQPLTQRRPASADSQDADGRPHALTALSSPQTLSADASASRTDPAAPTAQLSGEVARQIFQAHNRNLSQIRMQLNPAELGQLDLHLRVEGDRVHLAIVAQHASVRELLETQLPQLRALLQEGGFALGDVDVRHHNGGQRDGYPADTSTTASGNGVAAGASTNSAGNDDSANRLPPGSSDRLIDAFA